MKNILLMIAAILVAGLMIYFSLIAPVIEGVSKYGVPGFIFRLIEFLVIFSIVVILTQYHNK